MILLPYHLYVCPKDGKGYLEHIVFRDYLRNHPEAVKAYGELKMRLAEQFRTVYYGLCKCKNMNLYKAFLER